MGKISTTFSKIKDCAKDIYIRYLVTICASILYAFVLIYYNTQDNDNGFIHMNIILLLLIAGAFFIETCFAEKRKQIYDNKLFIVASYIVAFIIALVADLIVHFVQKNAADYVESITYKIIIFYGIALFCISLFYIIRHKSISFHTYMARAVFGLLKSWAVFLVLYIALVLLLELFDTLIAEIDYWNFLENIQIFLAAVVYLPFSLLAITDTENENSRFTKGFILYVLIPCVMAAILIIYMYIVKVFATNEIPSNEIFNICAWLFIIGMPIWTMAYSFTEYERNDIPTSEKSPNLYHSIIKYMKYIYAPFILLEIYAVGARISQYGLTEDRYVGILFILFQINYEIWEIYLCIRNRHKGIHDKDVYGKHYDGLILSALCLMFIGLLCPVLNAEYASYLSQKSIFEENLDKNSDKAEGAYYYLKSSSLGKKYLKENYTSNEIEIIVEEFYVAASNDDDKYSGWTYMSYSENTMSNSGLDVKGFSKVYSVHYNIHNEIEDYIADLTLNDIYFKEVDLTDCISYFKEEDRTTGYLLKLNANYSLYISYINFYYIEELGNVKDINITGYLLER